MDPYLHFHRTLALSGDPRLAWMSFAMDLPPAKELLHDFLWHDGKVPPATLAGTIHAIQDVLWSLTVRNHIADRRNVWRHRVAEILWTRAHYPLPRPDREAIKEALRPFGGWSEKTLEEPKKITMLYQAPRERLAELAGVSDAMLDALVSSIDSQIKEYLKIERVLLLMLEYKAK